MLPVESMRCTYLVCTCAYFNLPLLQSQIDAINGWEVDRTMEQAMESLRCPPSDALVANLSGGAGVGGMGGVGAREVYQIMEQAMELLPCPPSKALLASLSRGAGVQGVGDV